MREVYYEVYMTRILHTARISNVHGVMFVVYFYSLPMFLSRLNESSGGCEKIVPVSESFWSSLKFLRLIDLNAQL